MDVTYLLISVLLLGHGALAALNPLTFIHDLLQHNLAGIPITHERTKWNFDPDAALKRRAQYEKENGPKGMDLIERLGLGAEFSGP